MKHWLHNKEHHYHLKRRGAILSMGLSGGYKHGGFWIEEGCDHHFSAEYTKEEAIEMLEEAIAIIRGEAK